jgi:class 3 adenylate cyclase/tetratricopeptide (TPR) repeat protein
LVSDPTDRSTRLLQAYVPELVVEWLSSYPDRRYLAVDGTLAFVDIAGFTMLTERLASRGQVGAEEMSDILDTTFGTLIRAARPDGGDLVKWGGDAVLLFFRGPEHARHAARAAYEMRRALRALGGHQASAGRVTLQMSAGIHSGEFHFFLVGDPALHRELIVCGPAASTTAHMESLATASQIVVSEATAGLLPQAVLGPRVPHGWLLRAEPRVADITSEIAETTDIDLTNMLPPPIRAHLLLAEGVSEHRPITVAFVQFSGTDALLNGGGPPALGAALDECVRNIQRAAADHYITFLESDINRDGGKIMLVAGAPRTGGHDEDRMLRAVRQIVEHPGTLALRAGINRGPVFSGDFGPDFRRTYSVKGDTINLAARITAKAAFGQVIATSDVILRSQTGFAFQDLAPFAVKGKSQPVHAAIVGPIAAETANDAEGDFVGRGHEVGVLSRSLDEARWGQGTFVEVIGEPGMGKSRLINEIRSLAPDLHVVDGPTGSYHSNTPYYPFRTLLRRLLGLTAHTDPVSVANRLTDRVRDSAPHLRPWLPLLGVILDVELPPTQETDELDEQFRAPKVAEAAIEFLRLALPTPTLLVFDNVHLVDDASADLLRRLAEQVKQQPWLVLVTRADRPSGYVPDPSDGHERLALTPIDDTSALELLASTAKAARMGPQAMSMIARKAGGNPLFLRELVLAASRSGSVSDLPDSVEDVVTSQIDRLDPHDRTLLRYAAVLGVRFSLVDLHQMLAGQGQSLDGDALRRLGDFIERDGEAGMRFGHAVIRESAYAGLPYRLRRHMHQQVGQALERAGSDREDLADQLAMHFFHAGDYEKAWTYSRAAGDRARARYAHIEAIEFLERALDAAGRLGGISPAELASVYEQLGDVRDMAGLSTEAADAYGHGRRFVDGDPVMLARLMFKEGSIAQRLGKFSASLRLLSRGRVVLDGTSGADADAARSRLATRYAFGKYLQGKYDEAMRWGAIGASEAARAGDRAAVAYAYNTIYLAHLHAGQVEEQRFGELALAIYEELGDLRMQGHCLNNLAIGAMQDGRWAVCADLLHRAADLFRRVGDAANEANAVYNRADLLIRQGRFTEVEPLIVSALRAAQAVDDQQLVALVLRERGRMLSGLGRWEEALAVFHDARGRLASLGVPQDVIALDGALAECLLLSGRIDEGSAVAADALARARALRANTLIASLVRIQGFGLLAAGRREKARSVLEAGVRSPAGADGQQELALMMMALAQLSDELPATEASDLRHRGLEILDRLGVVAVPAAKLLTSR